MGLELSLGLGLSKVDRDEEGVRKEFEFLKEEQREVYGVADYGIEELGWLCCCCCGVGGRMEG